MARAKPLQPLTVRQRYFVQVNRGLVFSAVRKFIARHPRFKYQEDDLLSEGLLQFCKAVQTFDPAKSTIGTYGTLVVARRCRDVAGEHVVRFPAYQVKHRDTLAKVFTLPGQWDMAAPEDEEEEEEDVTEDALRAALGTLNPLEQRVLRWRFGLGGTRQISRSALAKRLRDTESHVRTLERRALNKLRRILAANRKPLHD